VATQAATFTSLLILVLAVSVLLAPLAAEAQHVGKVYRVGLIATTSPVSEMAGPEPVHPSVRAFVQGLRALGYVEGKNLILERRSAEGRFERFGDIVAELVRLRTDVIVAPGDVAPRAAKMVTTTVPIVMATAEDPVGAGLVQSLARPGGNVTGLMLVIGPEIEGKRLEIFREALPGVSRVAYRQQGGEGLGGPVGPERSDGCAGARCDARIGRVSVPSVRRRLCAGDSGPG
jgi:putative ABC transport system substrate-binding protein